MTLRTRLFGPLMFWTVLTSIFAWLPLVRIIGRPEGYTWGILGVSGSGTDGPFWIFVLLTLYVLVMLYSLYAVRACCRTRWSCPGTSPWRR